MMSMAWDDLRGEDGRRVPATLTRLHQQLLAKAEGLRATLAVRHDVWTVGEDVRGYVAPVAVPALSESERLALLADLEADLAALAHLTKRLAELRAIVADPPEITGPGRADEQRATRTACRR
jgi:hypothetical protein